MATKDKKDDVKTVEGWRPEPGDVISGRITNVEVATSTQKDAFGNYPQYPLVFVTEENGETTAVHCFHQTLQNAILTRQPEIGERITITFHGKKELKSDPTRSVAIYSLDLPDSPATAKSAYDQLSRQPQRRREPEIPIDDDDLGF